MQCKSPLLLRWQGAGPPRGGFSSLSGARTAEVIKSEEKGSDVNLATYLLLDGFRRDYEIAVIVTNDSNLVEPIKVLHTELKLRVGILNPHRRASLALKKEARFHKQIDRSGLARSLPVPPDTNRPGEDD